MKLCFKKICIMVLTLAMLMSSFVPTALAYDDGSITNDALKGSVSIMGLHAGATVQWEHVVVPASYALANEGSVDRFMDSERANARTGWIFYPNYEYGRGQTDIKNTTLMAFADAYGFSLQDDEYRQYNIAGINAYSDSLTDLQKQGLMEFEQDVMQEFIDDCSGRLSDNDPSDGNTPSATIHSSSKFQQALKNLADKGILYSTHGNSTANADGFVTIRPNLSKMNVDTGLYVMLPVNSGGILYTPTAAFVNFKYAQGTGENLSGDIEGIEDVVAHAKSTQLTLDKMVENGEYSYTKGDIVEFNITSTYPTLAKEMYATSKFWIEDMSCEVVVENKKDVVVTIGDVTLVEGTDYILEIGLPYSLDDHATGSKFVITLLDGDGSNGVADYNSQFAGKDILISYKAKVVDYYIWKNTTFYEIWNSAVIHFDSYSDTQMVKAYPVAFKLQKLEADTNNKLTGAIFVGQRQSDGKYVTFTYDSYRNSYVVSGADANLVDSAKITIVKEGYANVTGLDGDDVYVFTEIQAPTGYALSEKKIVVGTSANVTAAKVLNPGDTHIVLQEPVVRENGNAHELKYYINGGTSLETYSYYNTSLMALPSTGGVGTYVFTMVGTAVMATALLLMIRRRKAVDA